ncbi:helix-turn-helix domain-containing protein [Rhizobium leguminosarum]|uniref:helix-turn-helix domain-containing protein n=1 Tax=Rhizobium leguminosarum TaxID=384 RepID=UPI001C9138F3|nr:helix-turn-helix transcriptional regulator [Rhizobium leguminosarum]
MTSGKQIGSLVRQLRKAQGMTQIELAEAIGRTMDAVSMIERGNSVPSVETLIALSKVLNSSIESLLLPEDAQITPARRDKINQGYAVLASLPDDKLLIAVDQLKALARSS